MILVCSEDREVFGFGHRSRALALFDIFNELGIEFVCVVTNSQWEKELNSKSIKTIALNNDTGGELEANELLQKIVYYKNQFKCFICDGNRFTNHYLSKIKEQIKKIILIDDLGFPVRNQAHVIWNPNSYATYNLYKGWGEITLFAGPEFLLLRKEFYQPKSTNQKKSIFISLGKACDSKITSLIYELSNQYNYPVVTSTNFDVEQMIEAIDNAILTICGASVTLHEVWTREGIALPVFQAKDQIHFREYLSLKKIPYLTTLESSKKEIENQIRSLLNTFFNRTTTEKKEKQITLSITPNNSKKLIDELYY